MTIFQKKQIGQLTFESFNFSFILGNLNHSSGKDTEGEAGPLPEPHHNKSCLEFLTSSDINLAVQTQKMDRGLKFQI